MKHRTSCVLFVLSAMALAGCATTQTYHADAPQVLSFTLGEALPAGDARHDLNLYVRYEGTTPTASIAHAPTWNRSSHRARIVDMRLTRSTLDAVVDLELQPDQWFPADAKALGLRIAIRASRGRDGSFEGAYEIADGLPRRGGRVSGEWRPESRPVPAIHRFRIEGALPRGHSWWRWLDVSIHEDEHGIDRAWARSRNVEGGDPIVIDPSQIKREGRELHGQFSIESKRQGTLEIAFSTTHIGPHVQAAITITQRSEKGNQTWTRLAHGRSRAPGPNDWLELPQRLAFPAWADGFNWSKQIDITDLPGDNWDERFEQAQGLLSDGGGVIYFPPGEYRFADHLKLRPSIVIRGDPPAGPDDPRQDTYTLKTRFIFPRYQPTFEGDGTPTDTAFKGIRLTEPQTAKHCGVMHVDIDNGHVHFGDPKLFRRGAEALPDCGRWFVVGCILRNAATLAWGIPRDFQHGWQRMTHRDRAAIHFWIGQDAWIAANRIAPSGEANFVMKNAIVYKARPATHQEVRNRKTTTVDIPFDYDNRPGICVNSEPAADGLQIWKDWRKISEPCGAGADTDIPYPTALARGIRIEGNFVYCTGGAGIKASGDGTYIGQNRIRFKPNVIRPTPDGYTLSNFTNNNRAIEVRGWRWTVADNDYLVYSNYGLTGTKYNDGEGIMHEAWENVGIRDSRIVNNRGNSYICIWRVPVRGLLIQGNHITEGGIAGIFVLAQTNKDEQLPCENVRVLDNRTEWGGIKVVGRPGDGNVIRGNRHVGVLEGAPIEQHVHAAVSDNEGYR